MPFASAKSLRHDRSSESEAGMGERGGDTGALRTGVTGLRRAGDEDSERARFRDMFPRSGSSPDINCIMSPS
jgi:hypothetical protein